MLGSVAGWVPVWWWIGCLDGRAEDSGTFSHMLSAKKCQPWAEAMAFCPSAAHFNVKIQTGAMGDVVQLIPDMRETHLCVESLGWWPFND